MRTVGSPFCDLENTEESFIPDQQHNRTRVYSTGDPVSTPAPLPSHAVRDRVQQGKRSWSSPSGYTVLLLQGKHSALKAIYVLGAQEMAQLLRERTAVVEGLSLGSQYQ